MLTDDFDLYYDFKFLEGVIFSDIVHTDHTTLNVGYSNTNDINNCSFLTKGNTPTLIGASLG